MQDRRQALESGINCVSLAHLAMKDLFDVKLPNNLNCAEMCVDRTLFREVNDADTGKVGDLYWFGINDPDADIDDFSFNYAHDGRLVNWRDFPVKHVAVLAGLDESESPMLIHANQEDGVGLWPIERFSKYRRYFRLYGITRLIQSTISDV